LKVLRINVSGWFACERERHNDGRLGFGLLADRDALADLDAVAQALADALARLTAASAG
jgi:hypothetical protein